MKVLEFFCGFQGCCLFSVVSPLLPFSIPFNDISHDSFTIRAACIFPGPWRVNLFSAHDAEIRPGASSLVPFRFIVISFFQNPPSARRT